MIRFALSVTFVAILAGAAVADAACAWVLWQELVVVSDRGKTPTQWEILDTGETRKECREITQRAIARTTRGADAVVKGTDVTVKVGDESHAYRFRCLPETIDPRAPKASGRGA